MSLSLPCCQKCKAYGTDLILLAEGDVIWKYSNYYFFFLVEYYYCILNADLFATFINDDVEMGSFPQSVNTSVCLSIQISH